MFVYSKEELVSEFSVVENLNKKGLKRAKKTELNHRGKPLYEMQDTHLCVYPLDEDKGTGVFCVFDGHAGMHCAQDARDLFLPTFSELWSQRDSMKPSEANDDSEGYSDAEGFTNASLLLKQTFVSLDQKLAKNLYQGCTATAALLWNMGESRYVQVANVGDSRAYLCRRDSVICLTEDHKLSTPSERKRIEEMGIVVAPHATRISGLAITRALGDIFLKQEGQGLTEVPHVSDPIQLRNDDKFLIVASDGVKKKHICHPKKISLINLF